MCALPLCHLPLPIHPSEHLQSGRQAESDLRDPFPRVSPSVPAQAAQGTFTASCQHIPRLLEINEAQSLLLESNTGVNTFS